MRNSDASVTLPTPASSEDAAGAPATTLLAPDTPSASALPPSSRAEAHLGQVLDGRYRVEAVLGEGGMGFVYRGRHTVIDKRVAIKILRGDLATDQEMTGRFMNEARAASSIGNPHIVDISDFGRLADGTGYFVMEYLEGTSLAHLLDATPVVPVPRLLHVAKQIARGLAAAHARGIVHRDLKPDNVMLVTRGSDRDFVKILDFGIAKVGGETARLTRAGSVFGTPHYMSPEQAAGMPVDLRADVYALGVILYEMAAGVVPFDADNFMGILTQHMYKAPVPLRMLQPPPQDIPPGLEAIVMKALSKKAELRYASMDELVADLERVEQGLAPERARGSGAFDEPADYFFEPTRQSALQTPVSLAGAAPAATADERNRRGLAFGAALGVLLVVALVGGGLMVSSLAGGRRPALAAAPPLSASTVAAPSAAPGTPAAPTKVSVVITTEPADATIAIDDDPADRPAVAPRWVDLAPDAKVTLRVEHAGYKTQRASLDVAHLADPKHPSAVVKLEREPVARPGAAAAPVVPTKPPANAARPSATATPPPTAAPSPPQPTCAAADRDPWTGKCH